MKAVYYCIKSYFDNSIVNEGVVRHGEDTIYPQQDTGINKLPYECELHHFKADGYYIESWEITITREECFKQQPKETQG